MKKLVALIIILFALVSCKKEGIKKVDVSGIEVEVLIDRFEEKFYNANENTLKALKNEYPYLFPPQNDSIWLNKINNAEEMELFNKSQEVFKNFEAEKVQIEDLFKHVKYHHPKFKSPKIITLITNLDYQNKVMYADSLLFVSVDMYLGEKSEVYRDFPLYLAQNYDRSQLVVDIANSIGEKYFLAPKKRHFLDAIIREGKKMYLLDCYIPLVSDAKKMGYSSEKLEWTVANEFKLWEYFISNELLYSTDSELYTRFISDAPFSKFYTAIDKESPGRIGVWVGWQIVRSYMNNNNVTLQQLLQKNAEEIFKKSKYKPKK